MLAGAKLRAGGAVVFAYHDIVASPDDLYDYAVTAERFREQLTWASGWGVRFTTLAELVDRYRGGRSLDGLAAVVFDDGFAGVHRHAAPVLADLGVPSTLFAVTDELGRRPAWWPEAGRIMSRSELLELRDAGVDVGSHTRTHARLPTVGPTEKHEEVVASKAVLEDIVAHGVRLLAYPYGEHDPEARELAAGAGYAAAFTFLNGRVVHGLDPFRLPRLNMVQGLDRAHLAFSLARRARSWPDTQLDRVPT